MTALYIILIIIAVFTLFLLIPISCVIDFSFNRDENRGSAVIKYAFLTFRLYSLGDDIEKLSRDAEKGVEEEKKKIELKGMVKLAGTIRSELGDDILELLNYIFIKSIRIRELNISLRLGTGDAMYTGIAVGAANAAAYNMLAFIDKHTRLDEHNVSIEGDFDNERVSAGLRGTIRTSGINIIILGVKAAALLLKIQKINRRMQKND